MLTPGNATQMQFRGLPVGTLEFGFSSISPLPGLPGSTAFAEPISGAQLNGNGNTAIPLPDGITLASPEIVLSSGLTIPFTLHPPDRAANASGWYNASLTITWNSVDPVPSSGTPTTPAPTTVSSDGANQTVTSGKSRDPAGNCATGSVPGINLDQTPPSVSVTGVTDRATYTGGTAPTPACSTSDSLSGLAANATLSVTNSGTTYTATCSGATDNAGNSTPPVNVTYQVLPADWTTASLTDSDGNPIAAAPIAPTPRIKTTSISRNIGCQ
jgi:hypothetical protein